MRYTYPSQLLVAIDNRPWLNLRFLDRSLFWGDDQREWVEIVGQAGVEQPDRNSTLLTTSLWGTPYVLSWAANGCTDGGQVAQVGRLTSSESGWEWQELQLSNQCDVPSGVAGFLVDAQEGFGSPALG
jgi:fermentation-respiration switch protein FrsA (DUF1100 family)